MSLYNDRKPRLLLDIDNTLICSIDYDELKHIPMSFQNKFTYIDWPGYYRIFTRPYLQVFLDYAFANFEVSIFTAADKDYAVFIVNNIILNHKPNRIIHYLFHHTTCSLSEELYNSPKDLRILWDVFNVKDFNACNTTIIDDLDDVAIANPKQIIHAPRFSLVDDNDFIIKSQVYDTFMLMVIPLLKARLNKYYNSLCSLEDRYL